MKERITDEMLDMFGEGYKAFREHMESVTSNSKDIYTFEQYVDSQMRIRAFKARRAVEYNAKKEKA